MASSGGTGDAKPSLDELFPRIYEQLRAVATAYLRRERADHTLAPTALVHEAYIRLAAQDTIDAADKTRLLGLAAEMMRRILVNYAHANHARKRGGAQASITLDESVASTERQFDLVELDDALTRLAEFDSRGSKIVEMRFFAGLTIEETALVLAISPATVKREWSTARAWLRREMSVA
ncbi:MAG: ECF-type sigma factor [Gemmatimonadota bacterium]|nr:ECF-type sigma factor [Gemmatimonadota bacterium]